DNAKRELLENLAFLAYEEKLLAGSWRYLTYFGRDTLMSTRLLLGELKPKAVEAALGSVLERLDRAGRVAHEEDLSDFATLRRARAGLPPGHVDNPILDYKMVDDDFMLAPVLASYLLDTGEGRARAQAFLARKAPGGETYADLLERNLVYVTRRAEPYAASRSAKDLISLLDGEVTGQWRDSLEGLAGGRYPFDVNAVFVPAALEAAARIYSSELLAPGSGTGARAKAALPAWLEAHRHFHVQIDEATAQRNELRFARELGLPAAASAGGAVSFPAIALDAAGQPLPVMHSDEGAALLYGRLSDAQVADIAARAVWTFPRGRMTDAGMLTANAAHVDEPALRATFGRANYHGAVVWSLQQAQFLEGIARQLSREDLRAETRLALQRAQEAIWDRVDAAGDWNAQELWSVRFDPAKGRVEPITFGAKTGDATESNLLQLWSSVYLSVKRPTR
ncbi:MAG: hypothetical protein KC492_01325, partial [Myxococcales bacterium]|nr:hypothetical protein [Myxococcales bacterium]